MKGPAIETEDGHHRLVAQVTVYARALGVALAQKSYDTHASSERAALKVLLSTMDLDGRADSKSVYRAVARAVSMR